jgi:hypothetical protein
LAQGLQLRQHLFLKLGALGTVARFAVVARTQCDDVAHSISTFVCECHDVMALKIPTSIRTNEALLVAVLTPAIGALEYLGSDLRVAGVALDGADYKLRTITADVIDRIQ